MATIERSNIGELHDKLSVTLSKDDYYPAFEKKLKEFGKQANIPGFRKGQVPAGMIKKMYGQSVFMDEIIRLAYTELETYLKENVPNYFAQPMPLQNDPEKPSLDMNKAEDYTFNFEIGLRPEIQVKAVEEKAPLTKYTIAVTDEMMDKEIEEIRKRAGKLEDKAAQNSDLDIIHLSYKNNADEADEAIEDVVEFGKSPKALQEKLKACTTATSFEFSLNEIQDEKEKTEFLKSAQKLKAVPAETVFTVNVTKVAALEPRAMDETFYNDVFPGAAIKDEAGFRAELKKAMAEQLLRYSNERLQNEIFETLVHTTDVNLPESFLKYWLKSGGEKQKTDEEVNQEWSSFNHQLKWTLISDQLIGKYGIQVPYEEVIQDIKNRVSAYFGIPAGEDAPWMDAYIKKMEQDEKTLEETHRRLMMDKLFARIEQDLTISETEVSDEEFAKLPSAHEHHHQH